VSITTEQAGKLSHCLPIEEHQFMIRIARIFVLLLLGLIAFSLLPAADAATISTLSVTCTRTRVEGSTEVRARYVRVQVTLASDLSRTLVTEVVRVGRDRNYSASLTYPRQPQNTLLIISVGEWDGSQYLRPATLLSSACNRHGGSQPTPAPSPTIIMPPFTPTPIETTPAPTLNFTPAPTMPYTPTPIDTTPPPTGEYAPAPTPTPVLGDFYTQQWTITPTLMYDSCGIAPTYNSFTATFVYDLSWTLVGVGYGTNMHYWMSPPVTGPYIGQTTVGDALYTLDLFFDGPDVVVAFESVTQGGCSWQYRWDGVKQS
jgi:hypothetical protein